MADDEAFVAIQAASGEDIDIDALSTIDGSKRWRTTISGSEISNLFVSQQTVYLETDAPGGIVIRAFNDENGSQRWSQTFPSGDNNNGYFPGLGDVANGVVYAANDNNTTGTRRHHWQGPLAAADRWPPYFPPSSWMASCMTTPMSVENGPNVVYAFNPANGRELWQTGEFGPTADSLNETIATEANGLVYYRLDGWLHLRGQRQGWCAGVDHVDEVCGERSTSRAERSRVRGRCARKWRRIPTSIMGRFSRSTRRLAKQLWSYLLPSVGYNGVVSADLSPTGWSTLRPVSGNIYSVNSATGSQIAQLQLGGELYLRAESPLTLVG